MGDLGNFDQVFEFDPKLSYDAETHRQILHNRKTLSNELFLDRLFRTLNIKDASNLYPPKTNKDLRHLYEAIQNSAVQLHFRQSLVYYILLDCSKDAASKFAIKSHLPSQFRICTAGYWDMDHLDFENALSHLTQPGLIQDFPSEILSALLAHAPQDDMTLPLAYIHACSGSLSTPPALNLIFRVYVQVSVQSAYTFLRAQSPALHEALFSDLIGLVLSKEVGEERARDCAALVNLPFDGQEEEWFEEFLSDGKGRGLNGAKDMLAMRRLGKARFRDGIKVRGLSGAQIDGLGWDLIAEGIERGVASR